MSNLRVFAAECSPKDLNVEVRADDRNLGVQNAELNATSAKEAVDAKYATLKNHVKVVVDTTAKTVTVTPANNDNTYKGSVTLTYSVQKDLNVEVRADDRNLGVQNAELNATSAKEAVDAKYSTLNMEAVTVTVNNTDANNRTVKVTPKEGDNTYKGSVTLTYTVRTSVYNLLSNELSVQEQKLTTETAKEAVKAAAKQGITVKWDELVVTLNTTNKTITVKAQTNSDHYKGQQEVSYKVKKDLNTDLNQKTLGEIQCVNPDSSLEEVKAKLKELNPNVKCEELDVTLDKSQPKAKAQVKVKSTSTHY